MGLRFQWCNLGRLFSCYLWHCWLIIQVQVVGKVDNAFNSDKIYPVDNKIGFYNSCPLDSDFFQWIVLSIIITTHASSFRVVVINNHNKKKLLFCFLFQLYKQNVHSVVADFIPLIMNTIILQPSLTAR